MSSRVSSSPLDEAAKELLANWEHVRQSWRDQQALHFEKTYLEKLPALTTQARQVIEELDTILRKIRTDCESPLS
ncbi:MAG: hypothetical protein KDK99_07115 [Verrucomicrobiales bacterium]|nr:hypothetical protein [Verrucomicrobiales bacterium]